MTRQITFDHAEGSIVVDVPERPLQNFDDGEAMSFYLAQTAGLDPIIYEKKYPNIVYRNDVPVDTSYPEGVQSINYRSWDGRAIAKFIGANADDLPSVALEATLTNVPVALGGIEYSYSFDELRTSQMYGMPIDSKKAEVAFRAFEEHAQRVAYFGDAEHKMDGLFNSPSVTVTTVANDWSKLAGSLVNTTELQPIINDINVLIKQVWENTKGTFIPDTVLIPAAKFSIISGLRFATGTDTSVLNWLKENNFYTEMTGKPLNLGARFQLNDQGTLSFGRMVAYTKDPECVKVYHPMPYKTHPPQFESLRVKTPSEYKISGTEFLQPMSAVYADFQQ